MRESRTYGSVRGACSNARPYRNRCARKDLRADGIAQMRGAQWRGTVEQGCDRLPGQLFVRETVGFGGHAKALQ